MHGTIRENDSREGNRRELAAFEPVDRRCVDCDGLLSADVRTVLEVTVRAILLNLEAEVDETTEVLDDSFVDCRTNAGYARGRGA